jgi:hypothetical protein
MVDDKIKDQPPGPGPQARWRKSAETLATMRSDLPAVLAESVGLPAPTGPLGENLIAHTLDTLDALVPIGAVKRANDLIDATIDLGLETIPPIPNQIASAQSRINDAISRLAPAELRCAATQLGLQPTTMEWGVRVAVVRERTLMRQQAAEMLADVAFGDVGYPDADSDDHDDECADFRTTVAAAVHSLRTQQPMDWEPTSIESLRCAVALHLAQIGDAFLQTSERGKSV